MRVNYGLKLHLSEAGWNASWSVSWLIGRPGAGGIGTKTKSAPNFSWVGVRAELGNNFAFVIEVLLGLESTWPGGQVG